MHVTLFKKNIKCNNEEKNSVRILIAGMGNKKEKKIMGVIHISLICCMVLNMALCRNENMV